LGAFGSGEDRGRRGTTRCLSSMSVVKMSRDARRGRGRRRRAEEGEWWWKMVAVVVVE